jgi:hypothetical protein
MIGLASIMAAIASAAPYVKGAMTVASMASPIIGAIKQHSDDLNNQVDPRRRNMGPSIVSSALKTAGVAKNFFQDDDEDDEEDNIIKKINRRSEKAQRKLYAKSNAEGVGRDLSPSFFKSSTVGKDLVKSQLKKLSSSSSSGNLKDTAQGIIKALASGSGSSLAMQMKGFGGGNKTELIDTFKKLMKG